MNAQLTARPIEQVVAAIQALDLESVKIRLMDHERGEGWTREYADGIEAAYRTYLTMLAKYQDEAEDILLSEDVDEFWHTHILQTIKYAGDCESVFGTYLHHQPHIGKFTSSDIEEREIQADKTRRLYEREFGGGQDAAWYGKAKDAAASGARIEGPKAAASGARIQATDAATSGARIEATKAAASGARIQATSAAASGARIQATSAAASGARIEATKAAASGARIQATNAAASGARIQAVKAAASGARIQATRAAASGARIRVGKAAASGARVRPANDAMPALMAA